MKPHSQDEHKQQTFEYFCKHYKGSEETYEFQRAYILPVPEIRPCTEGSRGGIVGYQISRRAG